MKSQCSICRTEGEVKHFSIYVTGSEGIELCQSCELDLVEHLRRLMDLVGKSRITQWKKERKHAKD